MKYIDLTHTFTHTMPVFPGDPTPELTQISFLEKDGYNDFQIRTGMHVGTHIDSPLHMLSQGKMISQYPPEHFFGKGHLIDARGKLVDEDLLEDHIIKKGDIVFIMTGFYEKFGQKEYYSQYPEITESFALKIVKLGIKILGMDTPSPDRSPYTIHKLLLKNDVLIIENLTHLKKLLPYKTFHVIALPVKFDTEAAPVRVIAQVM